MLSGRDRGRRNAPPLCESTEKDAVIGIEKVRRHCTPHTQKFARKPGMRGPFEVSAFFGLLSVWVVLFAGFWNVRARWSSNPAWLLLLPFNFGVSLNLSGVIPFDVSRMLPEKTWNADDGKTSMDPRKVDVVGAVIRAWPLNEREIGPTEACSSKIE